jgi:hypothetical protein
MADVVDIDPNKCGESRPRQRAMAALAERQHGVVARGQLLRLRFSRRAVDHLIATGRLHSIHRGVYAVGHGRLTARGGAMAAVLACGPGAVLSHRSAAWLWNLLSDGRRVTDVTAPGTRRSHGSLRIHRARRLVPEDSGVIDGIPVTSLARTLLDVAESETPRLLRRAFEQAERLQIIDLRPIQGLLERTRGHRGAKPLTALIAEGERPIHETRSGIEEAFPEFCRDNDLPEPAMNVMVAGHCVDAYWSVYNVAAEIDTHRYHHTRADVERDIQRDLDLKLAEVELIRIPERFELALPVLKRALG